MKLRIIQWNIKINSKTEGIIDFLATKTDGKTIINLQEVSRAGYEKIKEALQKPSVFSLDHRKPGKYEGKNRAMGVMTIVNDGSIESSSLLYESVFPERTLYTKVSFNDQQYCNLTFHSLTGVDYKKAKSSNFASIASFISEHEIDFFSCDANEPEVDSLIDEEVEFFNNRDKGYNAGLLFGHHKVHDLIDTYKEYVRASHQKIEDGFTHITGKKNRRYDFIYCKPKWNIIRSTVYYSEAIKSSSDHGMVVMDLESDDLSIT